MKKRLGWSRARHGMDPGDVHGEALEQRIDEAVRLLMTQAPSPRAYLAFFDAVHRSSTAGSGPEARSSWVIAASACTATLLLAYVAFQTFGRSVVVSAKAQGGTGLLVQLSGSRFASWINESDSVLGYPGFLFLHTLGLALVVGVSTAVDLRILGVAPRVPLASVRALFPVVWIGFWMSAVSGTVLFIADATGKAGNPVFEIKLALVALGVMLTALAQWQLLRGERDMSYQRLRPLAIGSLLIWLAAIIAGRLVAYAL